MLNKLKDDILRLLKEDEEFRYAVVGLLGLQRLEEAISRLTDSNIELKNVVTRLIDTQANMEARLSKVEEVLTRLADIQARQEDRLIKVEDRLTKVEERLEEHDKKFNAILEELSIHRVKLEEHDKKFNEIIAEIKDLRKVTNELSVNVSKLTASMGTIGRRLGKDMEKMVLKIYRDQLMQLGIDPDKAKRFRYIDREGKYGRKGKEYEFDIVISNNHTDVLEVKTHTEKDDVDWFYENVEAIKGLFDKPLRRKVIVTVHIDEDALIKTDELGINVIYGNIVKD